MRTINIFIHGYYDYQTHNNQIILILVVNLIQNGKYYKQLEEPRKYMKKNYTHSIVVDSLSRVPFVVVHPHVTDDNDNPDVFIVCPGQ